MFTMYRNADVKVKQDNHNVILTINGDNVTTGNTRSQIDKYVKNSDCDTVAKYLTGGHFAVENGNLVEYKTSQYSGFIQTDEMIQRFYNDETIESKAKTEISIAKYGDGGVFNLEAGFTWSAFSPELQTQVNLLRLVCANGLKVRESLLTKKVPIINMYDRHLQIASQQTLKYAEELLVGKLADLEHQRASVRDVMLCLSHLEQRLQANDDCPVLNRLHALCSHDYRNYYSTDALSNTAISATLPSHLDSYTLLNCVTEMSSHTEAVDRSSTNALSKFGSDLILGDSLVMLSNTGVEKTFQSPRVAFMG